MDAERMTILWLEALPAWATALILAAHFAAGIALGIAYFTAVWWNARQFALGGGMVTTIALIVGRFVLLGGGLALTSLEGALPLLLTALGVVLARFAIMRRVREAAS
jgi:hypothetical protein